jgi:hypothetical protein
MNSAVIAKLRDLLPTQFALGMVQVKVKMQRTAEVPAAQREAFLAKLAISVVRGPEYLHIVDHHHWTRAWIELGIEAAPIHVKADFSDLDKVAFLSSMIDRGWIHPYDERGEKVPNDSLPRAVADMPDDPYQSLAAFLRGAGVFENPGEFNAKFAWADYLRKYVTGNATTMEGFAVMLAMAFRIAHTEEARSLPGYRTDYESAVRLPPSGQITI